MGENIIDVVFGLDHIVAEFFWNGVFVLITYLITKARALRKIHKYIDDKHDVKHDKY
jgi:hypothetical protein